MEGDSMSVVKGEYSIWTASMWWIVQARRRVVDDTSERPRYLIFPSLCSMFVSLVIRLYGKETGELGVFTSSTPP